MTTPSPARATAWARSSLKPEHQPYRGWGHLRPELAELDLFILDELALRKIVDAGRYAYLVVADVPGGRWCVWSTAERPGHQDPHSAGVATGSYRQKAKVLLDLREAAARVTDEYVATDVVAQMLGSCDAHWQAIEPWPHGQAVHDPFQRRTS